MEPTTGSSVARSSTHPQVGPGGLARLAGSLAGAALRRDGVRPALGAWVRDEAARDGGGQALAVCRRRLLLVAGPRMSAEVLASPPRTDRLAGGGLRRKAMAFLAPRALTISDDEAWERRRAYNVRVLAAGRPHDERQAYLDAAHEAFAAPAGSAEAIREDMGRLMLVVVFGDGAPAHLPDEVRALMGVVRSPPKRMLCGRLYAARRAAFREAVRARWDHAPAQSLVGRFRALGVPPSPEAVDQVPHWMFTFVLSGTDLLTRALAMIGSRPDALGRVREEIAAAGPLQDAAAIDGLHYVEACIREAGRLFAPVTTTSHSAPLGVDLDGRHVPAGTEIVHWFPLLQRDTAADPTAGDFVPERWLDPGSGAHDRYPNLFLSGPRECPGRDLIMFLCKAAVAIQVGRHRARVEAPSLASDPLPPSFPAGDLRFHVRPTEEGGDDMAAARAGRSHDELMGMGQAELDALYRDVELPGAIPVGDTLGTALVLPGRAIGRAAGTAARLLFWQGKVFDPTSGTLKNKVSPFGIRAIRARVDVGDSWLDRGTRAIVLDYSRTSLVARWIRDEIREVGPGLWLGKVFVFRWHALDFTLRAGAG
jgi:cytochrome P450